MDSNGIINLALVTILFSTIIAPLLKKIGDIRDEITSIEFPIVVTTSETEEDISATERKKKGTELTRLLIQYDDKYNEVVKHLKYFYVIIAILCALQIRPIVNSGIHQYNSLVFIGTLAVVIIMSLTIKGYLVKPSTIRSIQWLAIKKIPQVHTTALFEPHLMLNSYAGNIEFDKSKTEFAISSSVDLYGYGYIITIESDDYRKLYYLSLGFIDRHTARHNSQYGNGAIRTESLLASTHLQPGKYVARLLFTVPALSGNYTAGNNLMEFTVPEKDKATIHLKPIKINSTTNNFGCKLTVKHSNQFQKHKITHMETNQSYEGDNNLSFIFASRKLQRYLRRGGRSISFSSKFGDIDRYDLQDSLTLRNILFKYIKSVVRHPIKRNNRLMLLDRKIKSKLY